MIEPVRYGDRDFYFSCYNDFCVWLDHRGPATTYRERVVSLIVNVAINVAFGVILIVGIGNWFY